jgi:hypothetical protein
MKKMCTRKSPIEYFVFCQTYGQMVTMVEIIAMQIFESQYFIILFTQIKLPATTRAGVSNTS